MQIDISMPNQTNKLHALAKKPVFIALSMIILAGILLTLGGGTTQAQSNDNDWATPIILFEKTDALILEPVVTADSSGAVHVFWALHSEDDSDTGVSLIYYTRWDNAEWSTPLDIIAASQINFPNATVDSNGQAHVIWYGGRQLFYSQASVTDKSLSAKQWTDPTLIEQTGPHSYIATDSTGQLHLVYPGVEAAGVYYQTSKDGGNTWSFPQNVSPTSTFNTAADFVRLAVSDDGAIIHVVWTEFLLPGYWPPVGVFHAYSTDGGQTWSGLTEIAGEGYTQINVALVGENTVHVVWNGMAGVHGRYHRWSRDGGNTWSETLRLNTLGVDGSTGPPPLAVDSAGTLHLVVTEGGCVWYSSWQNPRWSDPVCISGAEARAANYSEEPTMTLSEGNRLHVVFWADRHRLWYTTKQVSAPAVPPKPFPTEEISPLKITSPTALPMHTPTPTSTPTAATSLGKVVEEESKPANPGLSILVSILPVVLLIGGMIIIQILRTRSH